MATKSQQMLFHLAANKQKIDANKTIPSQISTTVVTQKNPNNFWKNKLNEMQQDGLAALNENDDQDLPEIDDDNDHPDEGDLFSRMEDNQSDRSSGSTHASRSRSHHSRRSRRHNGRKKNRHRHRSGRSGGSKASNSKSLSTSSRRGGGGGWTTIAPEDEDVAKDFYIERLRRIYAYKQKEFDETKLRGMSLKNIRFKYNRHRTDQDIQSSVKMFSFLLFLMFFIIEKIVSYFIKSARVNGYTMKVAKSKYMKDFNKHLEKIIQRYFRSGTVNPWTGILTTFAFTMTMFNFDPTFLDNPEPTKARLQNAGSKHKRRKQQQRQQMPKPSYDSDDSDLSDNDNGAQSTSGMSMVSSLMQNEKIQAMIFNALPEMMNNLS